MTSTMLGLSRAQSDVLARLARGPLLCNRNDLASAINLSELGLARRSDQADRRGAPFEITPAGRRHLAANPIRKRNRA